MSRQPDITSSPVSHWHFRLLLGPQRCTKILPLISCSNTSTIFFIFKAFFISIIEWVESFVGNPYLMLISFFFFLYRMKFFIAFAAALATTSLAAPAENTDLKSANSYGQGGAAPSGCYWNGTPGFCVPSCDAPYFESKQDACGDGACCKTGYKVLCCKHK